MMTKHTCPLLCSSTAIAIAAMMSAAPAFAQEQDAANSPATQEIVVTGTYVGRSRPDIGALQTVSAAELERSPRTSIANILAQLPATMGNQVNGASNDQGNNPAASINLRGLGPRATLILLNGQRQVPISEAGGADDFSVDVNSLVPSVLLSRVEVLKDGASALYGSDAVAGVVNFITRDNLRGGLIDASLNLIDGSKDRLSGRVSLGFGVQADRTSLIVGVEYNKQSQVFVRDIYDAARITRFGQTSAFANPTTFTLANGTVVADPLCGSAQLGGSPNAGLLVSGRCRQDLTLLRGMIAGTERMTGYLKVKHELSDGLSINLEAGAASIKMTRTNSVGFPANTRTFTLPATSPANPFGQSATLSYRIGGAYSGDQSVTQVDSNTYRARAGLDWELADGWKASIGASYSVNKTSSATSGYFSASRFQAALNCQGGTTANLCFNPLASGAASNSQALLDWLRVSQDTSSQYTLKTYDGLITGKLIELPGGTARIALGAQRREESTFGRRDAATRSGDLTFGGANSDYNVGRSVNSAFAEVYLPVLPILDVTVAGRYEKPNAGSGSFNPKATVELRPFDGFTLTGTIGRSERAPGLLQYIQRSGLINIPRDPITGNSQNGVATLFLASTGLKPESSTNWNLGASWLRPTGFGSVKLGVNWWNIDFKDLITTTDVLAYVLANPNGSAITRDPATQQITLITLPGFFNSNRLKLGGLDFDAMVRFDLGSGKSLYTSIDGALITQYRQTVGNVTSNLLGLYNSNEGLVSRPKFQGRFAVGYNSDLLNLALSGRYISKLKETRTALVGLTEEKSYTTFDFSGSYKVSSDLTINLGVTNIFNKLPPAQGNSIYTSNSNAYPLIGRAFTLGARASF
jgi:iron complex outermembrane recepter protein